MHALLALQIRHIPVSVFITHLQWTLTLCNKNHNIHLQIIVR